MYKIKHIIISFNQKRSIIYKKTHIVDIENYLTLYKRKYGVQIIAYGLNSMFLHIIIRDRGDVAREYIRTIIETLDYYYGKEFSSESNLMRWKVYDIISNNELLDLVRYLHTLDYNSNKNYNNYSKYIYDEFIDTHLIMSSLGDTNSMQDFLKEPSAKYLFKMKMKEKRNINNKMFKRRSRAEDFFKEYLNDKGITRETFFASDNYKEDLVDKYRNETDLSFRDIGYVLGISHTSVIRIWNRSTNENY